MTKHSAIDFKAMRRDAETIADADARKEILLELDRFEASVAQTEREFAELETWRAGLRIYVAPPRYRIALFGVAALVLAALLLLVILPDMVLSGSLTTEHYTLTAAANPLLFWLHVAGLAVCTALAAAATLLAGAMFVKHPQPPYPKYTNQWRTEGPGGIDVLAEAEVYAVHGKTAQAIDLLARECAKNPQRQDIAAKLRELRQSGAGSKPVTRA